MMPGQAFLNNWWLPGRRSQNETEGSSRRDHHDENNSSDSSWGDKLYAKPDNVLRIGCRNINSLPTSNNNNRNDELIQDILSCELDVYGVSELNVAWNKISHEHRPSQRFQGYLEHLRLGYTYNKTDQDWITARQPGGTMLICTNTAAHRLLQFGYDTTGLGRWTWTLLRGKHGMTLRIFTVYRPVKSNGATSTFQQQQRYFLSQGRDGCPRDLFMTDLKNDIILSRDNGDKIIVMGDFNCDIRTQFLTNFFLELHLHEAILHRHGHLTPPTFERGSNPIDGIFTNISIQSVACGYTPFAWGMHTDHRLLWMDINMEDVFGLHSDVLWTPQARRLKLEDPRIVREYLKRRSQHQLTHNLLARTQDLIQKIPPTNVLPCELITILEELDSLRVIGILSSEKNCRKFKVGNVPWSPALQQSINNIRYLRLNAGQLSGKQNSSSRTLLRLFTTSNLIERPITLQDNTTRLHEEYQAYNKLKKESANLRMKHLESLAYHTAQQNDGDPLKIYATLLRREQQRQMSRTLKRIKNLSRGGVRDIEAPNPADLSDWRRLTNKEEVEQGCIEENIRRFTQAMDSPSLLPDQVQLLGWTGNTQSSTDILRGLPVTALNNELQQLSPYLQRPVVVRTDISTSVTPQDFISGWSKAKERTSSGKSTLHFGHFKASSMHPDTTLLDCLFLEISLCTGYSLRRWQQGIDVMIPKKVDSVRVDKLRTICLVEPDFNFLNKLFGKRLMAHAEKHQTIAAEQYGSRKKKSSILHATNKQLVFDIIRQTKKDASLMVLDAKSCYDRISPPIASISLRRQGAPQSYINAMFSTLDNMKHYIRTAYGDSDISYTSSPTKFHGILQGNGAGPMIWVMVSSPLLDKLRQEGCGISLDSFTNPPTSITAFAFVDDVDIVQELHSADNTIDTQNTLNKWEAGLWATGGILVPDKSNWYALRHHWTGSKWTQLPLNKCIGDLKMHSCFHQPQSVTQLDIAEATLALGVMFSPSGNMEPHTAYLLHKTNFWAEQVRTKTLQRQEAWHSLQVQVMKTIEYSLLATTMTKKQLDRVLQPILQTGLPRSGICRNISRAIVFSSIKHQGLGLQHPYVTQGLRKLELFLEQDSSTCTKHLIQHTWSLCSWESGLGRNFLSMPFTKTTESTVTRGWISCLWQFLSEYHIELVQYSEVPLRFPNDLFIMHRLSMLKISGPTATVFNSCRLYLEVELLSDIITLDGCRIRQNIWKGTRRVGTTVDTTGRPLQPRPIEPSWRTWRKLLSTIFSCNEQGTLLTRALINTFNSTNWTWFYHPTTDRVFERHQDKDILCHRIMLTQHHGRRTRHSSIYGNTTTASTMPEDCIPITTYERGLNVMIESRLGTQSSLWVSPIHNKWEDLIITDNNDPRSQLKETYLHNELVIVSDGSYKHPYGTSAWVISSLLLPITINWTGSARTTGSPDDQDSHRSEVFAILGGISTFHQCLHHWNLESFPGTLIIAADNYSAIRYALDVQTYPFIGPGIPDFDVLQAIRAIMKPNIQYQWKHVKGHQDKHSQQPLDQWAKLNIQADQLANHARFLLVQNTAPESIQKDLPFELWQVYISGQKLCKDVSASIKNFISEQTIQPYWHKKQRIPTQMFHHIPWTALATAMTSLPNSKRHWITKQAAQCCGVNSVLFKWRQKTSPACPRCAEVETTTHVFKCQHAEVQDMWEHSLTSLDTWLQDHNTDPNLRKSLVTNLRLWYSGQPFPTTRTAWEQDQDKIGWDFLLEGCIGSTWAKYQTTFLTRIRKTSSGNRWLTSLIRKLWDIAWDLWEHRNGAEHHNDNINLQLLLDDQIQLERLQGFGNLAHHKYGNLYSVHELDKLSTATCEYKRCWLKHIKLARTKEATLQQTDSTIPRMRQLMRSFLGLPT